MGPGSLPKGTCGVSQRREQWLQRRETPSIGVHLGGVQPIIRSSGHQLEYFRTEMEIPSRIGRKLVTRRESAASCLL